MCPGAPNPSPGTVTTFDEHRIYSEISNKSHPFFTGKQNLVDTAGRIEKFNKKYQKK